MHLDNWNPSITLAPAHLDISLADGVPSGGEPNGLGNMGHFSNKVFGCPPTNWLVFIIPSWPFLARFPFIKSTVNPAFHSRGILGTWIHQGSWCNHERRLSQMSSLLDFLPPKNNNNNNSYCFLSSVESQNFSYHIKYYHVFVNILNLTDVIFNWVQTHPRIQVWKERFWILTKLANF